MEATISVSYNPQMMPNVKEAIARGVMLGVERAAAVAATKVQENTPVARGILVSHIQSDLQTQGGGVRASIFAAAPADTYAAPVETGAVPHFPPPEALLLWVMKRFHPESDKQALSIAWAVARNIAKRGTSGAHMFQKGYEAVLAEAGDIIETAIAEELQLAGVGL